jgi:asparagine synthase (glutamine-hydrolysing)
MCGITGFIDFNKRSSETILQAMTTRLEHRGPDASGYSFFEGDAQIGLGHRRLSIIDLSETGKQPMQYGDLHIIFNGEIYNYQEIKNELVKLGDTFISGSDTEVILHAYAKWGSECLQRFIGMFAFVIYDNKKEELFCARDRAGVKPFFYYWHNNLFLFASELKAFHAHLDFVKAININGVAAFLQFGHVPTPYCIFEHTHKLKPGHTLSLLLTTKKISVGKYWDVYDAYNKPKADISFEEAKTKTEKVLKTAFDYRLVSDVPVGVFLSGGYDSTCLAALLQKDRIEKIKTFTIAVPDIGLNEAPFAKEIAKHLATEHHEFSCTQKEAKELITTLPYYYDEPFGDSSAIPTMLVSKMARQEITVALSADAGDEVFAGYNRYDYLMKHGGFLNKLPGFVRRATASAMQTVPAEKIPVLKDKYNFANRYEKLKSLLRDPSPENMMLSLSRQFGVDQLQSLFKQKIWEPVTAYNAKELKEEFYTPLSYMMAIDYQTYLLDDILQKVDRASMSVGLEAREPYLDHHVIEWAAQLPDNYKYHNGTKKYILREITHKYIPKNIMDRPKMGFAIPIEDWLTHDFKEQVNHYLREEKLKRQNIFNPDAIKELKTSFFSGKRELSVKIWYLLMFQMWYEKWME